MRRLFIKASLTTAALFAAVPMALADEAGKIFMFVREGSRDLDRMLEQEVGVMRTMLEDAGYLVDIATAGDRPMVSDSGTLEPTVALADVRIEDYDGLVLPCMAPASGYPMPERVDELAAQAVERGLPIAASRSSVVTLAKAGGVEDRRFTFAGPVDTSERPEFAGGTYMGTGVLRDGKISTAGICPLAAHELGEPDGTPELMQNFIESLSDS